MTKLLESDITSKSESENSIAFVPIDVLWSTQSFYLQLRCDCQESKIPSRSNGQNYNRFSNQKPVQKNNRLNAWQNDKKPLQSSSQKKNRDRKRKFSFKYEKSFTRQLSSELQDKKQIRRSKIDMK